jgi:hypothetical protein
MIRVRDDLKNTQIERAKDLLLKFVKEDAFWLEFSNAIAKTDLSQHDLLEDDSEIFGHIKYMFECDLNVEILPYKTKSPWSKVLGYAQGNRVYENTRKMGSLTLPERVGHLGHEVVHLFGYHHDHQGQDTSAAVVFGRAMAKYAKHRCEELKLA